MPVYQSHQFQTILDHNPYSSMFNTMCGIAKSMRDINTPVPSGIVSAIHDAGFQLLKTDKNKYILEKIDTDNPSIITPARRELMEKTIATEQFIQKTIDKSPELFSELCHILSTTLNEEQWLKVTQLCTDIVTNSNT